MRANPHVRYRRDSNEKKKRMNLSPLRLCKIQVLTLPYKLADNSQSGMIFQNDKKITYLTTDFEGQNTRNLSMARPTELMFVIARTATTRSVTGSEIRFETYGEDFGQTRWVTTAESHPMPELLLQPVRCVPSVLEIGCGSGGYAVHLAKHSGCLSQVDGTRCEYEGVPQRKGTG